jgi:hypothetical protein
VRPTPCRACCHPSALHHASPLGAAAAGWKQGQPV